MELTRKQVIKNLNALNAVCGQKDFYDKEMEESMRYAISSLKTDEAYQIMYEGGEIFTKADVVAMLEDLDLQIEESAAYNIRVAKVQRLIRDKINTLKEKDNGK